ncbi:hypothetical protein Syun_012337 [Stephania yunnanensis]|uniref:Uncharacterized protein n=1 Tax=Stephania yunnanensis TaxID=152371 RepID=A0AAP0K1N8_9MAGN
MLDRGSDRGGGAEGAEEPVRRVATEIELDIPEGGTELQQQQRRRGRDGESETGKKREREYGDGGKYRVGGPREREGKRRREMRELGWHGLGCGVGLVAGVIKLGEL